MTEDTKENLKARIRELEGALRQTRQRLAHKAFPVEPIIAEIDEALADSLPDDKPIREQLAEGREHLTVSGTFQSDKYPTVPAGKVPLSVRDPVAQPILWEYAQAHRAAGKHGDSEFPRDLEDALRNAGYTPPDSEPAEAQEKCLVCDGTGNLYGRQPEGVYGYTPCHNCKGTGKPPMRETAEEDT